MPGDYRWNDSSHRYYNTDTGRFIAKDTVMQYVDQSLSTAAVATDKLGEMVVEGMLSPDDWFSLMKGEIKAEYIRQYLLGVGGRGMMTASDWGRVGAMLKGQYAFLDGFRVAIASGDLSELQILARARMYIGSARQAYEKANAKAYGDPALPAYPGDGSTLCLSNCKCRWEILEVWNEEGPEDVMEGWDAFWVLGLAEHCDTCLDRAAVWNPLKISVEAPEAAEYEEV